MSGPANLERLARVARVLDGLGKPVVYVGGSTIALYVDEFAARHARLTDDVDGLVAVAGYTEYSDLEEELRALGLVHCDDEGAPICRWVLDGDVLVDIMPTDPNILGFSNRFYPAGFATAETVLLPDGAAVRVMRLEYLLATKVEAFKGRGAGDPLSSKDLEDIIAVLDGASCADAVAAADAEVRDYLACWFADFLLAWPRLTEFVRGSLPQPPSAARLAAVLAAIRKIAALSRE